MKLNLFQSIAIYVMFLLAIGLTLKAYAGGYPGSHHGDTINNEYVTNEYVTNEITEVTELTELTNTYNSHTVDHCNGVAISQATGNNQMYSGTYKPQLSLGLGECDGEVAGSLMFGVKLGKNLPLINGSIAVDEDVTGFGVGASWILK